LPRKPGAVVARWGKAMHDGDGHVACALSGPGTVARLGGRDRCEELVSSGRVGGPGFRLDLAYFDRANGAPAVAGVVRDRRRIFALDVVSESGVARVEWRTRPRRDPRHAAYSITESQIDCGPRTRARVCRLARRELKRERRRCRRLLRQLPRRERARFRSRHQACFAAKLR
jgi:hypothetical protein